jgi:hypothetical protein
MKHGGKQKPPTSRLPRDAAGGPILYCISRPIRRAKNRVTSSEFACHEVLMILHRNRGQ